MVMDKPNIQKDADVATEKFRTQNFTYFCFQFHRKNLFSLLFNLPDVTVCFTGLSVQPAGVGARVRGHKYLEVETPWLSEPPYVVWKRSNFAMHHWANT